MKSNIERWKELQSSGYFDNHGCYRRDENNRLVAEGDDDVLIQQYLPLSKDMRMAVIGCGFGRETAIIAPHVGHVYGVDVSEAILNKAVAFLDGLGIDNFTPVQAERWKEDLPGDLDFVYCYIVFQHLTRDLVRDYVLNMTSKLKGNGQMLCQFADLDYGQEDADEDRFEEPSVRWNSRDVYALIREAGMHLYRMDGKFIPGHGDWWWAHFGMAER